MRSTTVLAFIVGVMLALGGAAIASHQTFADVPDSHVHAPGVHWVANRGVMGFPDGTFQPNRSVTRGQVASMLQRTAPVRILLAPTCGTLDFAVWDVAGKGSGSASVQYSVNGGDLQDIGAIPPEDSVTFTVEQPGVMTLLIDGVAHATAHTLDACTP